MVRSFGFEHSKGNSSWRTALPIALALGGYCAALLTCFRMYVGGGVPILLVGSFAVALAPIAVYVALRYPLIVPFCPYVLFLPFDALSNLGGASSFTKVLGIAAAGAILLKISRQHYTIPPPRALAAWLVLFALMSASIFWSIEPSNSTDSLQMYGSLIALYALLSIVRVSKVDFSAVLGSVVVAGVVSAGYEALLFRNGQNVVNAGAGASRIIITVGDSIIDPNELAAALVLPCAIALYWLFNSRHVWLRILMIPTLATLFLGFAASGSRGGFFALGSVFIYLIVKSRHRLWLGATLVLAVLGALLANPSLPARFMEAQQDGGAGRGDIWRIGLYAFRDHWLTGAGIGNFPDAFDREYIHVFVRYAMGWHWVAHNVPLQIATELGVIGFTIYIAAYILQVTILRGYFRDTPLFELRLALEAACIGTFVAGLSTSTLNAKFVWLAFSVMALMRSYYFSEIAARAVDAGRNRYQSTSHSVLQTGSRG